MAGPLSNGSNLASFQPTYKQSPFLYSCIQADVHNHPIITCYFKHLAGHKEDLERNTLVSLGDLCGIYTDYLDTKNLYISSQKTIPL